MVPIVIKFRNRHILIENALHSWGIGMSALRNLDILDTETPLTHPYFCRNLIVWKVSGSLVMLIRSCLTTLSNSTNIIFELCNGKMYLKIFWYDIDYRFVICNLHRILVYYSPCHNKRRIGSMTRTKTLKPVFPWHGSYIYILISKMGNNEPHPC